MNIFFKKCFTKLRLRGVLLLGICATLPAVLVSCTENLVLEAERPAQVLVLNSVVAPGSPVKVAVQRTVFVTDNHIKQPPIANAQVMLTVNGQQQSPLTWDAAEELYASSYEPKAGDHIAIRVKAGTDEASAEVEVPKLVPIDSLGFRYVYYGHDKDLAYDTGNSEIRYLIKFNDPAEERNYYFIRLLKNGEPVSLNLTNEEVFKDAFAGINGIDESSAIDASAGAAFSDDLFDGKTYTLRVGELIYTSGEGSTWQDGWRTVQLYSVSKDYYKYLTRIFNDGDLSISENLAKVGLAEPTSFASNVEGGAGMLGAFQLVSQRFYLKWDRKTKNYVVGEPPSRENNWGYSN